jgi:hypothetical protein
MWPAFPTSDYYGSSATPAAATADGAPAPNPKVRRAPPGRFPRSPSTGRQGRRPAVPRGHRRALPQHSTRPRPPEQTTCGRDGPKRATGPSIPTAHSRQFRGCCPVSGLQPLVRFPYAFLPCYRTRPAGGGPLLDRQGPLPPSAAPPASGCPSASPGRYGGRRWALSHPPGCMAPRGAGPPWTRTGCRAAPFPGCCFSHCDRPGAVDRMAVPGATRLSRAEESKRSGCGASELAPAVRRFRRRPNGLRRSDDRATPVYRLRGSLALAG